MTTMLFRRVLVGLDGSPAGFVALDQARRLVDPSGELIAVTVCQERLAVHAGVEAPRLARDIHAEAEATAARARAALSGQPATRVEVLHGRATQRLRERALEIGATLIVVGSHSHSRAAGIVFGSVATELLHEGPAAVLVARGAGENGPFPRRVVAGADGSRSSVQLVGLACELGERFAIETNVIVAEGGKHIDAGGLVGLGPFELDRRAPIDALLAHARDGDLLIVGSRGLHGLDALGSVSERVAHRARCSVLVVRDAALISSPNYEAEEAADPASMADTVLERSAVIRNRTTATR